MPKLDREVVVQIRRRYDKGYPGKEIAKGYGVTENTVSRIGLRQTHKRVKAGNGEIKPYPYRMTQHTPDPDKARRAIESIRKRSQKR